MRVPMSWQIPPNEGESRGDHAVRAAEDLLRSTGTPARGPGSIDLVVDATGAETCVLMGLNAIKPGYVSRVLSMNVEESPYWDGCRGIYVQIGFGPPNVTVPMFRIVTNEITIRGAWRWVQPNVYQHNLTHSVLKVMARGITLSPLIWLHVVLSILSLF